MSEHSALVDSELHENKGVSSASDHTVATASSNATVWQLLKAENLDTSDIFTTNKFYFVSHLVDVSTAEKTYITIPFAGTLTTVYLTLQGAITTANAIVNVKDALGNSAGTITVLYAASAAGDQYTLTPSINNIFTTGQKMSIETDGGSTAAARADIVMVFTVTG